MKTPCLRAAALAAMLAACTAPDRAPPPPSLPVVATFTGEVDAVTGTVSIRPDAPAGAPRLGAGPLLAAIEVPVDQDGQPGTGRPDSVELVTESVATVPGGCGADDGFEGGIRLRSFYGGAVLRNVHVEIVSLTPTGREACNSAAPAGGLSATYGLFSYGDVGRAGTAGDAVLRPWRFRLPDQTAFTFRGHVVADLVTSDATAPVTVASPAGGLVGPGHAVALTCSDAESGCAATYFTTDGSAPTAASARYQAPIPITSGFTLRWFSVDAWGNAEAPSAATFTLDATPPTVSAVTPAAGAVAVAGGATVAVTFAEPVDPATVTTATFSVAGPGGPVAGSISRDAAGRLFTFTPAAALQAEAQYLVTVTSGVRDLAGNALQPAHASDFYTVTTRRNLQPATSGAIVNHQVAIGSSDGVAAWSVDTGTGSALVWAPYSVATATWGAASVLATDRTAKTGMPVRVVWDGVRYLVAWCTTDRVQAVLIQGGVAGAVADLAIAGTSMLQVDFAASSSAANRFFVARSFFGTVSAWTWTGAAWTAETTVGSGTTVVVAGNALYWLGGDNVTVRGATVTAGTGVWSAAVAVATVAQGSPTTLAVARGSSTLLAYGTTAGHVWATTGTGTVFGTPADVSGAGSEASPPLSVAAGALSGEYAVAWVSASGRPTGAFRNGGVWPASPTLLRSGTAREVALAGYSFGFLAATTVLDAGASTTSLWAIPSGGALNARTWGTPLAVEAGLGPAAAPAVAWVGSTAQVRWTQADPAGHELLLRAYDGAALGSTQAPSAPPAVAGSPSDVRLAVNAIGQTMAVWAQEDAGARSVYAALHSASGWGAPVRVAGSATWHDVASNGAGFLVTAVAASATTPGTNDLLAVPWQGGAFGAAEVVRSGLVGFPRVASDGAGYAAIWSLGTAIEAAIRADGTWLPVQSFGSGLEGRVAGRGGEYLFLWTSAQLSDLVLRRATGAGATWAFGTSTSVGSTFPTEAEVVAGPAGFFGAVRSSGSLRGWTVVAGVTSALSSLASGTQPCEGPRLAVSGARFLAALNCSSELWTAETDGTTASAAVSHATGLAGFEKAALGFAVSGDGAGRFRLLYSRVPSQFTAANAYVCTSTGGTWGSTALADNRAQATQSTVGLAWDGGAWLGLWTQVTAASPVVDDLVSWWAF